METILSVFMKQKSKEGAHKCKCIGRRHFIRLCARGQKKKVFLICIVTSVCVKMRFLFLSMHLWELNFCLIFTMFLALLISKLRVNWLTSSAQPEMIEFKHCPFRKLTQGATKTTNDLNQSLLPYNLLVLLPFSKRHLRGSIHCRTHTFYLPEWEFLCYNLARKLLGDKMPCYQATLGCCEWQKWYYLSPFQGAAGFKPPANEWINLTKANDVSLGLNGSLAG